MKVNNFVIDRALRGIMTSTADGSYMWSINQITEPSLNVTSETAEAVDALGSRIAVFNRGKAAEFTANNSIFDLGLFAAQNGVEVQEAGSGANAITTPKFDEITLDGTSVSYSLSETPLEAPTKIYLMNGDGTLGTSYTKDTTASATTFVYDTVNNKITPPTGLSSGDKLFVMYDYALESGTAVTGDAVNFPKAGKFILEVLGADVCDPTTLIHAFIIFPNAKLDANVDLSFTTDGNHPFTIQCQQDYCDSDKILFQIIIPDED